jgi:hypothetical protein
MISPPDSDTTVPAWPAPAAARSSALTSQGHDILGPLRLQPPLRHGEVDEHVRREQAAGRRAGLQELDQLAGQCPGGTVVSVHGHISPARSVP